MNEDDKSMIWQMIGRTAGKIILSAIETSAEIDECTSDSCEDKEAARFHRDFARSGLELEKDLPYILPSGKVIWPEKK